MLSSSFSPSNLTVAAGATVTWRNGDAAVHTVTSATGSPETFNSGNVTPGGSYSRPFPNAGTYPYYCLFHGVNETPPSGMSGTITVQ